MSWLEGAVPPSSNSLDFFLVYRVMDGGGEKLERLNSYPIPRQPAITKFGRSVTSTRSSSHSFATEKGWPYNRLSWSSSLSFGEPN